MNRVRGRPGVRRALAATLVLVVLAAASPQASAALNKPLPFHEGFPYMPGFGDNVQMTVVSGKATASVSGATTSYGFFDTGGLTISGLVQECHGAVCNRATSLVVAPGGSVAVCFPSASAGAFEAGHALGLFVDLSQDGDLNSFAVGKSLVAPAVDGSFSFSLVNRIQDAGVLSSPCTQHGGLAALDDVTQIQVRDGQTTVQTLTGKDARIAFSGTPLVTPVVADFYIIPFAGLGNEASFRAASAGDAKEGLDLQHVQDLVDRLDQAKASSRAPAQPQEGNGAETQAFLAGLLNGALLRLPEGVSDNQSLDLAGSHFARFSRLTVAGNAGGLDWDGKAYLEIQDGKVQGAKGLVGFWLFQLPWWSYLLWAAAITLVILRMVRKPAKENARWDQLKWIGWVATPVAWLIVFILWDFELRAVLGASLFHSPGGQFKLIIGLLQLGLLGLIAFAAIAPLRTIGRNASLLAKQGTFMGLAGGVAALLGFLIGAPYLRAYVGLILNQVMQALA